jgi:hypothetical protein
MEDCHTLIISFIQPNHTPLSITAFEPSDTLAAHAKGLLRLMDTYLRRPLLLPRASDLFA